MPKYKVTVEELREYQFEVDADSEEEAQVEMEGLLSEHSIENLDYISDSTEMQDVTEVEEIDA